MNRLDSWVEEKERKYNRWLVKKYSFQKNIPFLLKICPLYSPSLFNSYVWEGISHYINEDMLRALGNCVRAIKKFYDTLPDSLKENLKK